MSRKALSDYQEGLLTPPENIFGEALDYLREKELDDFLERVRKMSTEDINRNLRNLQDPRFFAGRLLSFEEWRDILIQEIERRKIEIKIHVVIEYQGKQYESDIDPDESFTSDITLAIKNGKNPVETLAYLADLGGKYHIMKRKFEIAGSLV